MTPKEFAKLSMLTCDIHEASFSEVEFNKRKSGYTKSWEQCADEAAVELGLDHEWAWLAQFINWTGYCDVDEWCRKQIGRDK